MMVIEMVLYGLFALWGVGFIFGAVAGFWYSTRNWDEPQGE